MIKDALWLTKKQWAYTKFGFAFTILFYAAYGGLGGMFSEDWLSDMEIFTGIMIDLTIVIFMSMNGFVFSKGYFNNQYWKTDTFTKKLAMLRSLPIPVESLAMSRSIQIAIMSPVLTLTFFIVFYATSDWARSLPLSTFISFVVVCFALGNASSCWFVIQEWSRSGKRYFISSCIVVALILAIVIPVTLLSKVHLFAGLTEAVSKPAGWLWAVLALALAVATHAWMQLRLRRILRQRDFA
jgi:accessory gene regulator protein AgrB